MGPALVRIASHPVSRKIGQTLIAAASAVLTKIAENAHTAKKTGVCPVCAVRLPKHRPDGKLEKHLPYMGHVVTHALSQDVHVKTV